jgi:hypothetical protein
MPRPICLVQNGTAKLPRSGESHGCGESSTWMHLSGLTPLITVLSDLVFS